MARISGQKKLILCRFKILPKIIEVCIKGLIIYSEIVNPKIACVPGLITNNSINNLKNAIKSLTSGKHDNLGNNCCKYKKSPPESGKHVPNSEKQIEPSKL